MSRLSPAAPTCGGDPQVWDWTPPSQQQYLGLTTGGRNNMTHTHTTAASIHPLLPLLIYSNTHLPPASPFTQPIRSSAALQADAHPCHHDNSVPIMSLALSRPAARVKKPLNAFMLFMKEMRHKVLQEGRERESAAINRILGRRWRALSPSEQSRYYDLARKERLLHMQLYPGWSAKDNYGKKKKAAKPGTFRKLFQL